VSDFEKFLDREARKARIRRDIIPAIQFFLACTIAFFLGRCTA
jgi:hypothetical protein